ncbi:RecB family exonuclease [Streptomyces sp. NPDC056210]|uniref:RecB family exonuclease n=1 Tax=Streptomyces sp. NPDC056210 TaxID=3345746 RepID=UPI0035DDAAE6
MYKSLTDEQEERWEKYKNRARSWSQTKQYMTCPYQFLLSRIVRAPEMRGAWLEQGVAVHAVIEEYEKSERSLTDSQARSMYQDRYSSMINASLAVTSDPDMWFSSGPYRGLPQDIERRYRVGADQVSAYLEWSRNSNETKILHNFVELRFVLDLDGVEVLGFIDQVVNHVKKGPGVRDIKTGQKPTEHGQLELYALAVKELHDVEAEWGDYWLGKTGKTSRSIPLDTGPSQRSHFVEWFAKMDAGVKAGDFLPKPGDACERCPVQLSCAYRAGS